MGAAVAGRRAAARRRRRRRLGLGRGRRRRRELADPGLLGVVSREGDDEEEDVAASRPRAMPAPARLEETAAAGAEAKRKRMRCHSVFLTRDRALVCAREATRRSFVRFVRSFSPALTPPHKLGANPAPRFVNAWSLPDLPTIWTRSCLSCKERRGEKKVGALWRAFRVSCFETVWIGQD